MSKKPNCYRRAYIPDFAATEKKMHVSGTFLIPCTEWFSEERKKMGKTSLYPGRYRAWASLCSPRIRARPDVEVGEMPSRKELQPQQEL